jgi:opacity protein-like surface antigen
MGGVNIEQAADIDAADTVLGRFDRSYDSDTGWFAGLKFGYEFESTAPVHAALELEALYSQVDGGVRANRGIFRAESRGDIHEGAVMFNALVKFKPVWRFRPYLGAGVGLGYVDRDDSETFVRIGGRRIATRTREGGDDFTFAYQGIAGFDWWVTDRWTLFTEYKALVFNDAVGLHNYLNHLVGVGVRVKF